MKKQHFNGPQHVRRKPVDTGIRTAWCTAIFALFFLALAPSLFAMDGKGPEPGTHPLDDSGQMQVGPEDRCPVCGMNVQAHRKFSSAIQLNDGTTFYFCGTGCMIRSWLHPEIFLGREKSARDRPVTREYFTGQDTDAREVTFVAGSDIIGPMGPALVPVKGADALKTFKSRHGGKTEFLLEDLDDGKWFEITGKKVVK